MQKKFLINKKEFYLMEKRYIKVNPISSIAKDYYIEFYLISKNKKTLIPIKKLKTTSTIYASPKDRINKVSLKEKSNFEEQWLKIAYK